MSNGAINKKVWRFYRSNLSTIVWDPGRNRPLADFSEGHFTTDDEKVARELARRGYLEIPIDCTTPPNNIILRQPSMQIDGDVPIISPNVGPAIAEQKMKMKMKTSGGAPSRSVSKVPSSSEPQPLALKKTAAKSRTLTRRPKRQR